MKQLVCEMCGSTDLIKQDAVFVCQCCGCKYSVEEAKKMMVEGVVAVQGTVSIDNTNQVDILLKRARIACEDKDFLEAQSIFRKAITMDPENGRLYWECFMADNKNEVGTFFWSDCHKSKDFQKALRYGDDKLKALIGERINEWLDMAGYDCRRDLFYFEEWSKRLQNELEEIQSTDMLIPFVDKARIDALYVELNNRKAMIESRMKPFDDIEITKGFFRPVILTKTMVCQYQSGEMHYEEIETIICTGSKWNGFDISLVSKNKKKTFIISICKNPFTLIEDRDNLINAIVERVSAYNSKPFTNIFYN